MSNERRTQCAYPWQQMNIDLTGEVSPCCFWGGYGNTGKPLGNTNAASLDEIWNGDGYRRLRLNLVNGDTEGTPCHECLAYQWGQGQYPQFVWPSVFTAESGHCYLVQLPESFRVAAAAVEGPYELYEDGQPLGPGEAVHDDIRQFGGGRFSVWGEVLYLSASDNTDPKANGRVYEVRRGAMAHRLPTFVPDSTSGRNLLQAHAEYQAGATELTARPTLLSFIGTSDCNIDCGFCSQNKVRRLNVRHRPETEPDVLAHVPYLVQLIWHGGEPFMIASFRQFIDDYQVADNPNLAFGFTSNGVMVTEAVQQQLLKFPRLNASISMDSFQPGTFQRIRAGAKFDVVFRNLKRLLGVYDAPTRVISVGAVVMKSNLRELADNLQFALDHDIGVNFGPLVIYPIHERLDVFEDIDAEAAGWEWILDDARALAEEAVRRGLVATQRVNPLGMLHAIEQVVATARARYRESVELTVQVNDPTGALPGWPLPVVQFLNRSSPEKPLAYLRLRRAGTYTVRLPACELDAPGQWAYAVLPNAYDELDCPQGADFARTLPLKPLRIDLVLHHHRQRRHNLEVARDSSRVPLHVLEPSDLEPQQALLVEPNPVVGLLRRVARATGMRRVAQLLGLR